MAYALQSDIVTMYGDKALRIVSDRDRDGIPDVRTVQLALDTATAEIDSYLSLRYKALPLQAPSNMLKIVCVDIAMYRMGGNDSALTDELRKRYDDSIAWLKLVAKGDVSAEASSNTTSGLPGSNAAQPGTGGIIIPTIFGGLVTNLTLMSPGSGYIPEGVVPLIFSGGGGNGAAGTATIASGKIVAVSLTKPGAGYTALPTVLPGLTGSALDPSLYPPAVTGGKRAGIFFSENRVGWPGWISNRPGRTYPNF